MTLSAIYCEDISALKFAAGSLQRLACSSAIQLSVKKKAGKLFQGLSWFLSTQTFREKCERLYGVGYFFCIQVSQDNWLYFFSLGTHLFTNIRVCHIGIIENWIRYELIKSVTEISTAFSVFLIIYAWSWVNITLMSLTFTTINSRSIHESSFNRQKMLKKTLIFLVIWLQSIFLDKFAFSIKRVLLAYMFQKRLVQEKNTKHRTSIDLRNTTGGTKLLFVQRFSRL